MLPLEWQGTPVLNYVGFGFVVLLIMAFVTPSLIRKQPGTPPPPDYYPLVLWVGSLTVFSFGTGLAGLGWAVGVNAGLAVVVGIFCWRGARW